MFVFSESWNATFEEDFDAELLEAVEKVEGKYTKKFLSLGFKKPFPVERGSSPLHE